MLPPVVTGAVVMLIGFNLAPVVATIYWPQDQWVALLDDDRSSSSWRVGLRGFVGRIAIFLGLIFGYLLSWIFDRRLRPDHVLRRRRRQGRPPTTGSTGTASSRADWFGFPPHTDVGRTGRSSAGTCPTFNFTFILLVLPAVIALIAENTGHVKAVAEMTKRDLDPVWAGRSPPTASARCSPPRSAARPTTTYAENIGVMAATRVYSTAAYYVAAVVAILFGLSPKFGALVSATPGGVLGGITVVLYGMIGLLGAKIWKENRVDFGNPVNLVPVAAGIIIAIGDTSLMFTDTFTLSGIALGTIVTIVAYHLARAGRRQMRDRADGAVRPQDVRLGAPDAPGTTAHAGPPAHRGDERTQVDLTRRDSPRAHPHGPRLPRCRRHQRRPRR